MQRVCKSDPYKFFMMKKQLQLMITILLLLVTACGSAQPTIPAGKDPVKIAVIDTGFSSRAIPEEHVLPGKNYLDENLSTEDTYGHGTAIASIILEHCPDAMLVPLVSNAFDDGTMTQVDNDTFAQIIRDAVDVYQCDIINISAGLILDKDSVYDAIMHAEEKGVLVVASAGNDYASCGPSKYYPAAYGTVVAVGSINPEGTEISSFSQRGDWVDLYVCGEDVTIGTLSGNTRTSDGTSYSAAKVSAYAAQILMDFSGAMTVEELREKVQLYKNNK